jgi:hypothetical protein
MPFTFFTPITPGQNALCINLMWNWTRQGGMWNEGHGLDSFLNQLKFEISALFE